MIEFVRKLRIFKVKNVNDPLKLQCQNYGALFENRVLKNPKQSGIVETRLGKKMTRPENPIRKFWVLNTIFSTRIRNKLNPKNS